MTALVLRWRVPDPAISLRWRGPAGMIASLARYPSLPVAAIVGPPGPAGASAVTRYDVLSPAGTWTINHDLGRVPIVQPYLASGEQIIADIVASDTTITVIFGQPTAGFILAS